MFTVKILFFVFVPLFLPLHVLYYYSDNASLFFGVFPYKADPKSRKGISNNSIGWIFSGWAKRPMQEDSSVAT